MTHNPGATPPVNGLSVFAGVDICELAGLTLRSGARRPRYDDDVWDLTELADAPRQLRPSMKILNFAAITHLPWRSVAKDVALALLAPHDACVLALPQAIRKPRNPATVNRYLRGWRLWFNWLFAQGITTLGDVDSEHCDAYLAQASWSQPQLGVAQRRLEPNTIKNLVTPVQVIASYGELILSDRYAPDFVPWDGRPAHIVAGYKPTGENTTQPVADDILRPLLANALYLVDVVGPHIAKLLSAVRHDPLQWTKSLPHVAAIDGELLAALEALLQQYEVAGEPLPQLDDQYIQERIARGWDPHDPLLAVHIGRLYREIGVRTPLTLGVLEPSRSALERALATVGRTGLWARNAARVPHAQTGENICWTEPLTTNEVHQVASYAMGAAMIITAALTGMRRSELMEIVTGSRRVTEVSPGRFRYRVTSKLIKGQPLGGTHDEWVTVEEVHRAIGLAETLTTAAADEALFGGVNLSNFVHNFRSWCTGDFAQRLGLTVIPEGPVNARMLRRTLAIEIATRPNGLLAAKIHLKHLSVATTEGYVARPGGSQSVFRAEMKAEENRHHLELTMAAFQQYQQGTMPTGPGARELIRAFKGVDDAQHTADSVPIVLDNERRLENLLRQKSATLHIGYANLCWFSDPSKALCLKLAGSPQSDRPIVGMCDSTRCPQATHHQQHRPVWLDAANTVKAFLGNPRVPKDEKRRLEAEYNRTMRVVESIDNAAAAASTH